MMSGQEFRQITLDLLDDGCVTLIPHMTMDDVSFIGKFFHHHSIPFNARYAVDEFMDSGLHSYYKKIPAQWHLILEIDRDNICYPHDFHDSIDAFSALVDL